MFISDGICTISYIVQEKFSSTSSTTGRIRMQFGKYSLKISFVFLKVLFIFELVWPLLLFSIVAIVRKTSPIQNRPACKTKAPFCKRKTRSINEIISGYYNPMPLPNSGTIGFLQSFLCNTNVSCRLKPFDAHTSSLKN